ncbi:MAG: R3H domain-containing nucleic acid-binding protein [Acidobacteriota bacterium]
MMTTQDKRIERVAGFLKDLLETTGLELDFQCDVDDEGMRVDLHGVDAGLVLDSEARLLYAINHILNRAFYERGAEAFNVLVDCNNYRSARAEELELLARGAADSVIESGNLHLFDPMPASERRLVHLALAEEPGVVTESEGVGTQRRVVVLPAK